MSADPASTGDKEAAQASPPPIFGAGTALGSGTGFAGFGTATGFAGFSVTPAVLSKPSQSTGEEEGGAEDEGPVVEEECQAEFKPVVQLEEVETTTGEEEEGSLLELKCKLYRFDQGSNEWKERGTGLVRLLQHKENKKVRLLMRQEKTLKVRANHIVIPNTKLQEHSGSDKAWVWSAVDFADDEQKVELFAIRFGSVEKAQEFKKKFEEAMDINATLLTGTPSKEAAATKQDVADLAEAVGHVKVAE